MDGRFPKHTKWALWLVLLAVSQWNWFSMPFERDEGEYAYSAQVLINGGLPYRDTHLNKPPMIIYTNCIAQFFSPTAVEPIHLIAFLFVALTGWVVWWIAKKEYGDKAAWISAVLFIPLMAFPEISSAAAKIEKFMNLPMVLTLALYLRNREKDVLWHPCLAGGCASLAVFYKQTSAPVLAITFAVWGLETLRRKGWAAFLKTAVAVAMGAIVVAFPVWLPFRQVPHEMLVDELWLIPKYTAAMQAMDFASIVNRIHKFFVWWWPALGAMVLFFLLPLPRRWFWGLLLAAGIGVGLRDMNGHYWILSVPIVAVIAGSGIDKGLTYLEQMEPQVPWRRRVLGGCFLLLLLPCLGPCGLSPAKLSASLYAGNPFVESKLVAKKVAEISSSDDAVYIAGSEAQILVYAQRKSATRFVIAYPLMFPTPLALKFQEEVKKEILAKPPTVIVLSTSSLSWSCSLQEMSFYQDFLVNLLSRYEQVGCYVQTGPACGEWVEGALYRKGVPSLKVFKRRE